MMEKLSPFHVGILVYMSQIGIIVFTLPRQLADYFGTNGWLVLLPGLLLTSFNIYLITLVHRLGGGKSVFEIMERSVPKAVLYPVYLGLCSVWLLFGCMIGKKYVLLFQMLAFPTTNPMVFKMALDVLLFLLLIKGIFTISKVATFFFWMTFWMYFIFLWFLPSFNWVRLTPFILQGGHDQIKGAFDLYSAYLGYELSILLFPYMDKSKKSLAAIYAGNAFLSLVYICLSLICFGFFSFGQLKKLLFPLLDMLAYIQFPFVERLENMLYGFFLFLILITAAMYWWGAMEAMRRMIPKLKIPVMAFLLTVISYCISYIPKTLDQVNNWILHLGYAVTGIAFGLPVLLIALLLLQGRRVSRV
ncbi:GerAB/ArcD/ProY family transporter [Paenibacillus sonchi]|uniref:GerAB/ArcD/ProY family transporter n=1 Tax=Paenibacillus sonchi TaxID=373687 RepID=A0A974PD71_9BACL|nr:GerAB/ArcD/ProY family transporter [Paenibacillus sonchi]QQZ61694.1 GerAB/ArcD/ProY family transporter [Paenibacillus sonchi]